jgi:hypothetical protein
VVPKSAGHHILVLDHTLPLGTDYWTKGQSHFDPSPQCSVVVRAAGLSKISDPWEDFVARPITHACNSLEKRLAAWPSLDITELSRRIALKGNIEHLCRVALWSRLNLITDGEMTIAYLLLSRGPWPHDRMRDESG